LRAPTIIVTALPAIASGFGSTVLGAVSGVSVYLRSARPRRSVDSAFAMSWCSTGRAALRRWLSADFSGPVRPGSRSMQRRSSPAQRAH